MKYLTLAQNIKSYTTKLKRKHIVRDEAVNTSSQSKLSEPREVHFKINKITG